MLQKKYKNWERILSYVVFLLSTVVYLITMEKSSSSWDCPEFIITFHKLEAGHPPGAPFYMLVYNFFSHFFPGDPSSISVAANAMSAILSGLTILLLFRTISHLIRRSIMVREWGSMLSELPTQKVLVSLGGALVGSLLYAFTDTFWYSAVEAEVYSFSSFFTALVFYLMLRWEDVADDEGSDRWLVAIAYLMGLSIGVHLLNLLALPAMGLLYYFKRYDNPTLKGGIIATVLSFVLIAIIMFGIVQGVPEVAGWFDVFAVNTLGLPFNSGLVLHIILLFTALIGTYISTLRRPANLMLIRIGFLASVILMGIPFMGSGWIIPTLIIIGLSIYLFKASSLHLRTINVMVVSMFVFFLGVSTYGVILIRANSDIPMNQNTPSNVFSLRYYLSRDQYGKSPLLYGQSFASLPAYESDGSMKTKESTVWKPAQKNSPEDKDRYEATTVREIVYRDDMNMLFPRMYNNTQPHYPEGYRLWSDMTGKTMNVDERGSYKSVEVPTFGDNLRYFFAYQVNYMYWRYFLWNFSGRQNDLQGQGEITKGNWITGIPFIDAIFLGPQDDLPDFVKDNKGYNRYYMLPLILGLLGLFYQINGRRRNKEAFWITLALFFMTGLAIVIYINQPPYQVRERDYSFSGSFYAFSIWIGFAVPAIYSLIEHYLKDRKAAGAIIATVLAMGVPALVLAENYDDHNRHGRRLAADFGRNYLESCEPNGIIFCNGDNDTFPLWYAQEVEGVRKDLRVCNTSYLQADWYIEQMRKDSYDSKALPIAWGMKEYGGEKRSLVYVLPLLKDTVDVANALAYAVSDDPRLKRIPEIAQEIDHIPSGKLSFAYNPAELLEKKIIYPSDSALMGDQKMHFDFSQKKVLGKHELTILHMYEQSKMTRPFYYCITVGDSERLGMTPNFRQTGMAYQVMPFRTQGTGTEIDVERMYDNIKNKFRWGGADRPGVYMDENARRTCETYRNMIFAPLADALMAKGDTIRAKEILNLSLEAIHPGAVPHNYSSLPLIKSFYNAGDIAKAEEISVALIESGLSALRWYYRLDTSKFVSVIREIELQLYIISELFEFNKAEGTLKEKYGAEFETYEKEYMQLRSFMDRQQG